MRNLLEDFKGQPIRIGTSDGKFILGVLSDYDDAFVKIEHINCGSFEITQYIAKRQIANFSTP